MVSYNHPWCVNSITDPARIHLCSCSRGGSARQDPADIEPEERHGDQGRNQAGNSSTCRFHRGLGYGRLCAPPNVVQLLHPSTANAWITLSEQHPPTPLLFCACPSTPLAFLNMLRRLCWTPQLPTALVALGVDSELQSCRYRLVRKKFTDEMFWRSYAYQVERICVESAPSVAVGAVSRTVGDDSASASSNT